MGTILSRLTSFLSTNMTLSATEFTSSKTVVVLGAAYGGAHAAQTLATGIPEGWRVILIDRNSHANHVYVMPRYSVLPHHEYKAFIPYTKVFLQDPSMIPHIHLQAHILSITRNSVTLNKAFPEIGIPTSTINFDYAIYALGSHLPTPLDLWNTPATTDKTGDGLRYYGEKSEGVAWLQSKQQVIKDSESVLVVGGGALGIQFATDIAAIYPNKKVTLLHSRTRLLPRFQEDMHTEVLRSLKDSNVEVILGERLDLDTIKDGQPTTINKNTGKKIVRTITGREIPVDLLLLCTGQKPNTSILKEFDSATVDPQTSLVHVLRTLQISVTPRSPIVDTNDSKKEKEITDEDKESIPYPHIFAIGDAADAFGAIAAGHTAYAQGELAAKNIIHMIENSSGEKAEPLEKYYPGPPAIKVSLGLTKAVYQVNGEVGTNDSGVPDLQAAAIWPYFGLKVENDDDMRA